MVIPRYYHAHRNPPIGDASKESIEQPEEGSVQSGARRDGILPFRFNDLQVLALVHLSCGGSNPGSSPAPFNLPGDSQVVFLRQNAVSRTQMSALYQGPVTRDHLGCLRTSGSPATVIWPKDYTLIERDTELWIGDSSGRAIGRIGGAFRLGGGHVGNLHDGIAMSSFDRHRATESCPGIYWIVSEVLEQQ